MILSVTMLSLQHFNALAANQTNPAANINSPWIRESPFRFLTYKYRFLLEGRQWNCHSKFPVELPVGS